MGNLNLKGKKVVVIGGNGYLGTFLVKALKEKEAIVSILSLNCDESANNYSVDITNFDETNKILQQLKPDIVYHLAANISRNRDFEIFDAMNAVNVQGTYNILKALTTIDAHFIFTSTSEVYGNNSSPFHENQLPKPVSPYSLTKINAEMLIQTFCNTYQKKYTVLRVFNFFGEHMPKDFFIPQMIDSLKRNEDFLMTKGEQIRDFLYIADVVDALLLTALQPAVYGETMNVCSGIGTKLNELATSINTYIDTKAKIVIGALPYRANEVWEMIGDNQKIKNKLGFTPKYSVDEGIKILVNQS